MFGRKNKESQKNTSRIVDDLGNGYEGDIRNNLPHGQGKMTYTNGNTFEGAFCEGKVSGYGKMTFVD